MSYLCHFSCGAASAVATKIALDEGHDCRIIYLKTNSEHPDNKRFLRECETWFGQKIERHSSERYADIWDVFEKERYLVGVAGARCTSELKRKVAESLINWGPDQETEIFGYTAEEKKRADRFVQQNTERKVDFPLIRHDIGKAECFRWLQSAGIELPAMYLLGYNNNNCIGCVKGGGGYWNKIRVDFPQVFNRMAEVERKLDAAINKTYVGGERQRVFLDELPPTFGKGVPLPPISCGMLCEQEDLF